jgi:type I restriction enzyme S subunit
VELQAEDCERYWLSPDDVLFQRGNTREYVGMAAIFDGPAKAFVIPDLMIRVRFSTSLELRFVHMMLVSPPLRSYFSSNATGASATMPKINQSVLLNAPVPLPPLAEQRRIVAKIDELMALCDQLEAQLTTTQIDSRRLMEAVLRDALVA